MSVHKLDPLSKTYFLQEGREIGFLRECINETSIKQKAIEDGLSVQEWDEVSVNGTSVTVYALPRSSLSVFSSTDCSCPESGHTTGREPESEACPDGLVAEIEAQAETDHPELIFVAEYPNERGDDYCTYVFVSEPDADCLNRAYRIQHLKHELCFGDLEPTFVCEECGKRTHWLLTPRERANPLRVPIDEKYRTVKRGVCGRAESLAEGT